MPAAVLVGLALLLLPLPPKFGDELVCEPDGSCRSNCSGQNVEVYVAPAGAGAVNVQIHVCSQPSGCLVSSSNHDDSDYDRQSVCTNGCGVVTAPEQGKTWGDVATCDDLKVHCRDC